MVHPWCTWLWNTAYTFVFRGKFLPWAFVCHSHFEIWLNTNFSKFLHFFFLASRIRNLFFSSLNTEAQYVHLFKYYSLQNKFSNGNSLQTLEWKRTVNCAILPLLLSCLRLMWTHPGYSLTSLWAHTYTPSCYPARILLGCHGVPMTTYIYTAWLQMRADLS